MGHAHDAHGVGSKASFGQPAQTDTGSSGVSIAHAYRVGPVLSNVPSMSSDSAKRPDTLETTMETFLVSSGLLFRISLVANIISEGKPY